MEKRALITKQTSYSQDKGTYGKKGNIAENGCGAIAAYNACQLLERPFPFQEALLVLGSSALGHGRMGTNPFALLRFLKAKGLKLRLRRLSKTQDKKGVYIVLYLYSYKGRLSGHYVTLYGQDNCFLAYNDSHDGQIKEYASIRELKKIHKAKALWAWQIK